MTASLLSAVYCFALFTACTSFQWSANSTEDDTPIYLCDNQGVTLNWTYTNATNDNIITIEWFFRGDSDQLIATFSHGHFNVLPEFIDRVELTSNAGLTLFNLTSQDSGNYTVEIGLVDASVGYRIIRKTARVFVTGGRMTKDGDLHADQSSEAVYNSDTGTFHAQLTCGSFFYLEDPPFDVQWTTPAGQVVNSSFYQDGQFVLLLDNPVTGGSYTCHLPDNQTDTGCPTVAAQPALTSNVTVDDVKVQLAVLDAQQAALVEENAKLKEQVMALSNARRISFHATGLRTDSNLSEHQALIFPHVINNQGNAYNPDTGSFIAPYDGTYCFMASSGGDSDDMATMMVLLVDEQAVDMARMRSHGDPQPGSVQAVVQLRKGQRVWLQSGFNQGFFANQTSAFSGFLVFAGTG